MRYTESQDMALRNLGLSTYERKAIFTLVGKKKMTAEEISDQSAIPVVRVYDTMDQLEEKGLIQTSGGRPKLFELVDPSTGFNKYLEKTKEEFRAKMKLIEKESKETIQQLSLKYKENTVGITSDSFIEGLKGLSEMEEETRNLIKESKQELKFFTTIFGWSDIIQSELHNALDRGVYCRVLLNTPSVEANKMTEQLRNIGIDVRNFEKSRLSIRGMIQDKDALLFVIWVHEREKTKNDPVIYRPHISRNKGMIQFIEYSFEYMWDLAKPSY